MQLKSLSLILPIALLLTTVGCSNLDKPGKENVPVPVYKTPLDLDLPEPIDYNQLEFNVITDKNANAFFLDLTSQNKLPVYICMTQDGYKKLNENMIRNESYTMQLQYMIQKYKVYYESEQVSTLKESR